MLKIDALTKRFGDKTAVDAANISVEKPTMIGIIGRSGAGKPGVSCRFGTPVSA